MSRSVPLAKAMDDALIALYQNGEHPSNGYPMRLLLPGYGGVATLGRGISAKHNGWFGQQRDRARLHRQ
jgi:hypothetical protein